VIVPFPREIVIHYVFYLQGTLCDTSYMQKDIRSTRPRVRHDGYLRIVSTRAWQAKANR
jgi:hypothetical protein